MSQLPYKPPDVNTLTEVTGAFSELAGQLALLEAPLIGARSSIPRVQLAQLLLSRFESTLPALLDAAHMYVRTESCDNDTFVQQQAVAYGLEFQEPLFEFDDWVLLLRDIEAVKNAAQLSQLAPGDYGAAAFRQFSSLVFDAVMVQSQRASVLAQLHELMYNTASVLDRKTVLQQLLTQWDVLHLEADFVFNRVGRFIVLMYNIGVAAITQVVDAAGYRVVFAVPGGWRQMVPRLDVLPLVVPVRRVHYIMYLGYVVVVLA